MIRILNYLLMTTCVVTLVGVYTIKDRTEVTASEKSKIEANITKLNSNLSLMNADWAYLNQPGNIAPIIARHQEQLDLQVAQADQFKSFDDLPMRPRSEPDTEGMNKLFEAINAGEDPIGALIEAN